MKKLILLISLSLLPIASQAVGNRSMHCRSKSAELVFHTIMYGDLAVGDYTRLNGQRSDLPNDVQGAEGSLAFYNQGRIFQVENARSEAPLQFKLLAQLFGPEPTVIETGICEDR